MIVINEQWPTLEYGPCGVEVSGVGWYQRQRGVSKILLDINLVQRQWASLLLFRRANMRAVVDTGSPYTVMSLVRFRKAGFEVPGVPATNLGITGVVRRGGGTKSDGESRQREFLWGWPDVALVAYPFTLWLKLGLAKCNLKLMVAKNVDDDEFLVGLDFLQHYPLLLQGGSLVLLGS